MNCHKLYHHHNTTKIPDNLEKAVHMLYRDFLKTEKGEKIAIVTDDGLDNPIAYNAYKIGKERYGEEHVDWIKIESDRESSSAIPELSKDKYDIIIAPTRESISHSKETREARRNGARIVSMPKTTVYDFITAFSVDRELMQRRADYLDKKLENLNEITIKCPKGTNITVYLDHNDKKHPIFDCGNFSKSRGGGNIPFGEYAISPKGANGRIVFTYSGDTEGDCVLDIENGNIVDCNDKAQPLVDLLEEYDDGCCLAEFAIGINPDIPHNPEDPDFDPKNTVSLEKMMGTIHFGFGNNTQFGGTNDTGIHKDVIILNPSFYSGEKELNWWKELENIN